MIKNFIINFFARFLRAIFRSIPSLTTKMYSDLSLAVKESTGLSVKFKHLPLQENLNAFGSDIFLFTHAFLYQFPSVSQTKAPLEPIEDNKLVDKIINEYIFWSKNYILTESMWDTAILNHKKYIHKALLSCDKKIVTSILRQPHLNSTFKGFDSTEYIEIRSLKNSIYNYLILDKLLCFAEIVGVRHLENPEYLPIFINNIYRNNNDNFPKLDIDAILDDLEEKFGFPLVFPNPFEGELGYFTKRGLISYRTVHSLYQAWRLRELSNSFGGHKVLEIGAGLGRTAYFARLFGLKDYTIVDIPLTNVAQIYFLGRVLGDDQIKFGREALDKSFDGLKILSTVDFKDHNIKYDFILNCDSLVEMEFSIANNYYYFIRNHSNFFLSINHDINNFTVQNIYSKYNDHLIYRQYFPLRRGYSEELISFKS
jgi:hypothetical protein